MITDIFMHNILIYILNFLYIYIVFYIILFNIQQGINRHSFPQHLKAPQSVKKEVFYLLEPLENIMKLVPLQIVEWTSCCSRWKYPEGS